MSFNVDSRSDNTSFKNAHPDADKLVLNWQSACIPDHCLIIDSLRYLWKNQSGCKKPGKQEQISFHNAFSFNLQPQRKSIKSFRKYFKVKIFRYWYMSIKWRFTSSNNRSYILLLPVVFLWIKKCTGNPIHNFAHSILL